MEQYLIDTNIVSDYLSCAISDTGLKYMDDIIDSVPNISIISKIELLSWRCSHATELKVLDFVNECNVLNISDEVVRYCVVLRKSKKIKTPDAIIAATALSKGYAIITHNKKDFSGIKGLRFIDPHDL